MMWMLLVAALLVATTADAVVLCAKPRSDGSFCMRPPSKKKGPEPDGDPSVHAGPVTAGLNLTMPPFPLVAGCPGLRRGRVRSRRYVSNRAPISSRMSRESRSLAPIASLRCVAQRSSASRFSRKYVWWS